ncbi:MAG: HTH domain-containing protein [Deltaproteobacteria bacterium]|nr:HTH domain-containing protein [Deltaproteobacteria bacterium]
MVTQKNKQSKNGALELKRNLSFVALLDRYNWILRMLKSGIPLNCTEIAERTGCTVKTAQRYVNQLRRDGYRLEYIPKLRGYIIAEPLPEIDDRKNIIKVLRAAYTWARLYHSQKRPAWMEDAEKILNHVE